MEQTVRSNCGAYRNSGKNNAVILDIGQADIHNNLSLGILFQSCGWNSEIFWKNYCSKSYELDVNIRFNPITEEAYDQWVSMQEKNRYIITIVGRKFTAKQIAGVTRIVAEQEWRYRRYQASYWTYPWMKCPYTKSQCWVLCQGTRVTRKKCRLHSWNFIWTGNDYHSRRKVCSAVCAAWFVSIWTLPWLKQKLSTNWRHTRRCRRPGKGNYRICHAWGNRLCNESFRQQQSHWRDWMFLSCRNSRKPSDYRRCGPPDAYPQKSDSRLPSFPEDSLISKLPETEI